MPDHTMRVVEISQFGSAEVLNIGQRPIPQPNNGEVLIKVAAAGLNRADVMQRQGKYPPPPGVTDILGLEVSGTIVATASDVKGLSQGDEVCALLAGGGYAEYCVVHESHCLPVPKGISLQDAAAIPETFFTVWTNVFMQGNLTAGEKFFIHGGTSGIGSTAIQLAKAFGAIVFATAGSDAKCKACLEFGADYAINYRTADFVEEVLRITEKKGVNLILDIIAGPYVPRNIKCLAMGGRMVIIATQGGFRSEVNILPIMIKRLTISGSTLRARNIQQKAEIAQQLRSQVWPLLENQSVKPVIDSKFPMEDVRDAHKQIDSGTHIGKILLTMD